MLDLQAIDKFLADGVAHYEKTAPTVAEYLDNLHIRVRESPGFVRVSELMAAQHLREGGAWMHPNYAANFIFKVMDNLGMDTTSHAGF